MCNTWSNVYLQSMKTYTLSVNTLTRNLTLERRDNCASCLGLILPIRWVTPPPNSCLKCFNWRHNCKVFSFGLSSTLIWLHVYFPNVELVSYWYTHIFVFCPLQHSLIAMSSCLHFLDLSECDRTLTLSVLIPQILSVSSNAFCWHMSNVFTVSLSAKDTETRI